MALYHPGLGEALHKVDGMDEAECLATIDSLYGRDNLKYGDGIEAVRDEVRRQLRLEFTDTSDPGWEKVEFFKQMYEHNRRNR